MMHPVANSFHSCEMKTCVLCMKWTDKECGRCGEPYCSLGCQQRDWIRHRYICIPMPPLITRNTYGNNIGQQHLNIIPNNPQQLRMVNGYNMMANNQNPIPTSNSVQAPKMFTEQNINSNIMHNIPKNIEHKNSGSPIKSTVNSTRIQSSNQNTIGINSQQNQQHSSSTSKLPNRPPEHNVNNNFSQVNSTAKTQTASNSTTFGQKANSYEEKTLGQANQKEKPSENKSIKSLETSVESLVIHPPPPQEGTSSTSKHQSEVNEQKEISIDVTNLQAKIPSENMGVVPVATFPESGSRVFVLAAVKPNLLYIRSQNPEIEMEYVKIVNRISNEARNSKQLKTLPKTGEFVVADFYDFGFYRALVLNPINENKILVHFIDAGNFQEKKLSELRELPPEALKLKRFALPVRLKGVPPDASSEDVMEYLNDSIVESFDNNLKIVYEKHGGEGNASENKNDQIEVELINLSLNESVNKKIIDLLK